MEQGVEMISCNIDSIDECSRAFENAYGVYAMTNYWESGAEREYQQGLNMVNAARQQNVQHFIWSSLPNTLAISQGKLNLPHYMLENILQNFSINLFLLLHRMKARVQSYICAQENPPFFPYTTFIYIGFYYQNFQTFFQPTSDFEFRVPLEASTRLPLYDVRDTGPVVAQCFAQPERWGQGNIVPIVAQRLTMNEICRTFRRVTGNEKIRFTQLTDEQCAEQNEESRNNMRWYNEYGDVDERDQTKTKEVYNQMKTLEEWIEETKCLKE